MAEYTVVYISTILKKVRVMPLITYDYIIQGYSNYIRADLLLYAYDAVNVKYLKIFEDGDPEIIKYANKLKLVNLIGK